MKIYKKVQVFDRKTGKPTEELEFDHYRCDYTGEILDVYEGMYASYDLNYGDADPCFGSSSPEYDLQEEYGIDTFQFFYGTYHFKSIAGSNNKKGYSEALMMKEALDSANKKDSPWYRCFTFDAMCRVARCLTAKRLLAEKEIEPWQLGKDEDGDE